MQTLPATAATDTCPRCGGGFHCGAHDPVPCPCSDLALGAALQATLRQRYSGCLCLTCLQALAAQAITEAPATTGSSPR
ncbi:cysteine-rich CWC family protein [Rubrivivax sp. RP6-9]|uniref:cysteine-rich CWC family protein n=1 Tax=Rubrivivax sp. RP6-9 TaxID=3415750 RepID=UPI003CC5D334